MAGEVWNKELPRYGSETLNILQSPPLVKDSINYNYFPLVNPLFPCLTKFSQDYRFKPAWLDSRQDYTRKLFEPDTTQLTFCSGVALQQRTAWQRFAKSKNLRFNGSSNAYMSVRPSITSPIDWPSVGGGFMCPDTVLEELPLAMLTTSDWKCNSQDVIWASHSFCRDKRGCKVREWIT